PFQGSDLVTFSYKGEVLLMIPVEIPATFSAERFQASAHVAWQVCDEICILGDGVVSMDLPVDQGGALRPHPQWATRFEQTRDTLPHDDHTLDALFAVAGDRISFSVTSNSREFADVTEAWFFPDERRVLKPGPLRDVLILPGVVQISHGQPRRMLTNLTE